MMTQSVYTDSDSEFTHNNPREPEYVEITPEFDSTLKTIIPKLTGLQESHLNTATHLLALTLKRIYQSTDIQQLCVDSNTYGSVETFSNAFISVLEEQNYKRSTERTILCAVRKILSQTPICKTFIDQIGINNSIKQVPKNDVENAIPSKIRKTGKNSAEFKLLQQWGIAILKHSRVKSISTLRQLLYFVIGLLTKVNINIINQQEIFSLHEDDMLKHIKSNRHQYFLKTFYKVVFERDIELVPTDIAKGDFIKCDSDVHRIPADELDKIYIESKKDIRTQLMILLFITTGIRIGGLANIKLEHICDSTTGVLTAKTTGRTIEKNSKWFTFAVCDIVKPVLWDWVANKKPYRPGNPYLFPGRGANPMSTNRIREIVKETAKAAGVEGEHVHPHSFRHSFAHILLECGNSVEDISKMVGHSSSKTTEQFYLKESAAEVGKRMNVPWLENTAPEKIIPNFLSSHTNISTIPKKDLEKSKQKRERRKGLLLAIENRKNKTSLEPIAEE